MFTNEQGEWFFDFETFEKQITSKTKLVILTNPHNPTGKIFTKEEIARVTEILKRHPHVHVLSDDVYYFLPFDGREYVNFANFCPENWSKTITIYSSGKMLNATGWKIGWTIGPADLVKQAMFVHECTSFNLNVPGQIAIAQTLDKVIGEPYKGHKNYVDYTCAELQGGRDSALQMISHATKKRMNPTVCESGYFLAVDVEGCKDIIPAKYFKPGNYEDDPATQVLQFPFAPDTEVPLDFALCRYLAVEKGLSIMPLSNFCLPESPYRITNMIRISTCKTADTFANPALIEKMK